MICCRIAALSIFFLQASSWSTITQYPESLTVNEGEFTIITCKFNHSDERLAASAEFYRMPDDRNPMKSSLDGRVAFTSTDGSLTMTILKAIICDTGTYICKVKFFHGEPHMGNGTTLNVTASKTSKPETATNVSYTQTIVELMRISLLLVLILIIFILLCKFW